MYDYDIITRRKINHMVLAIEELRKALGCGPIFHDGVKEAFPEIELETMDKREDDESCQQK